MSLVKHPRRPRGDQWGREKRRDESFQEQAENGPCVPTLTGLFPNGQATAGSWLGIKNALYYCAQSATASPESFSWVRTRRLLTRSRLVWLMHQRIACSRLRDGGGKSFSNKKCEKRAGAGERQGGGACTHFLTACSGISAPDIPSDWSIVTVNIIT